MLMVDGVTGITDEGCTATFRVREGNIFCSDGSLSQEGVIESVAQTAAAFAGYEGYCKGESPKLGFIGEVKKFSFSSLPKVGETMENSLKVLGTAAGTTLVSATVFSGGRPVAQGQMKISIRDGAQ